MYINGQWQQSTRSFAVFNPATGSELGQVPDGDAADARRAIDAAVAAFPGWAAATAYERSSKLYRAYELMLAKRDELARLMTAEQGKPLRMAVAEVRYAADFLLWFAEEAKRVYGESIPSARADQRFWVRSEPVGVVCAITPWNYPVSMITRKVAPALAAGCTIVLKPAEVCDGSVPYPRGGGYSGRRGESRDGPRSRTRGRGVLHRPARAQVEFHRLDRGRSGAISVSCGAVQARVARTRWPRTLHRF